MTFRLSDIERAADIAINKIQAHDTAVMDREDLRQEALLGALQAERRYDGRGGKRAWLSRRANGACIDAVRKMSYGPRKKSVPVVRLQDPIGEGHTVEDLLISDRPSPMVEGLEQVMKTRVLDLLENLSEKERLVISLHYYEDMALNDVARIVGLSQPHASQVHRSALKKLRSLLVPSQADGGQGASFLDEDLLVKNRTSPTPVNIRCGVLHRYIA